MQGVFVRRWELSIVRRIQKPKTCPYVVADQPGSQLERLTKQNQSTEGGLSGFILEDNKEEH